MSHKIKRKAPEEGLPLVTVIKKFLAGAAGFEPATYGFGEYRNDFHT